MSRPPEISHRRIVRALRKAGFVIRRQGKHLSMYSEDRNVVAIIPRHNPVKRTTLARILKQIDMTLEEFLELL